MKRSKIVYLLIVIGTVLGLLYFINNYSYFKYGKRYNAQRNKFKLIEISDNLYCTNKKGNLRFSIVEEPKDLTLYMDSVGFQGHIDKFIFFKEDHFEEDVFIDVKQDGPYLYRCYYYYEDNSKKCTLTKPINNDGEQEIDCGIIERIFHS